MLKTPQILWLILHKSFFVIVFCPLTLTTRDKPQNLWKLFCLEVKNATIVRQKSNSTSRPSTSCLTLRASLFIILSHWVWNWKISLIRNYRLRLKSKLRNLFFVLFVCSKGERLSNSLSATSKSLFTELFS